MNDGPTIHIPKSDKPKREAETFNPENMRPCEEGDTVFLWCPPIFGVAKYLRPDEVSGHWVHNWIDPHSRGPHNTGCDDKGFLRCFLIQHGIIENFGKMTVEEVQAEMERQDRIQVEKQQADALRNQIAGGGGMPNPMG